MTAAMVVAALGVDSRTNAPDSSVPSALSLNGKPSSQRSPSASPARSPSASPLRLLPRGVLLAATEAASPCAVSANGPPTASVVVDPGMVAAPRAVPNQKLQLSRHVATGAAESGSNANSRRSSASSDEAGPAVATASDSTASLLSNSSLSPSSVSSDHSQTAPNSAVGRRLGTGGAPVSAEDQKHSAAVSGVNGAPVLAGMAAGQQPQPLPWPFRRHAFHNIPQHNTAAVQAKTAAAAAAATATLAGSAGSASSLSFHNTRAYATTKPLAQATQPAVAAVKTPFVDGSGTTTSPSTRPPLPADYIYWVTYGPMMQLECRMAPPFENVTGRLVSIPRRRPGHVFLEVTAGAGIVKACPVGWRWLLTAFHNHDDACQAALDPASSAFFGRLKRQADSRACVARHQFMYPGTPDTAGLHVSVAELDFMAHALCISSGAAAGAGAGR